jgi:hypothetical protein
VTIDLESTGPIVSSPIQLAKDFDAPLPSVLRAHEKPPVVPVAADEFRIEWRPPSLGVYTAGPMSSGELAAYLRHRSPLAPELVLEPKPLDVDRTGATALRVSGVMAVAALVSLGPGYPCLTSVSDLGMTTSTLRCRPTQPVAQRTRQLLRPSQLRPRRRPQCHSRRTSPRDLTMRRLPL